MINVELDGQTHVMTMTEAGSAISLEWQTRFLECLDEVETHCADGPGALVITGSGKAFNVGIDLQALMSAEAQVQQAFVANMPKVYRRLLVSPVPTVAALNGHAFAGGGLLALCADFRIMREDKGWFCLSEVDVGVPIGLATTQVLHAKLSPATIRDAVLTGKRYSGPDAMDAGIVDSVASDSELLGQAKTLAATISEKKRAIYRTLKQDIYKSAAEALAEA